MSDAVRDYIYEEMDLTDVEHSVRDNTGWNREQMEFASRWYRNFLWLAYKRRNEPAALGIETHADRFWHAHILYTQEYAYACERILGASGAFIHHKPLTKGQAADPQLLQRTLEAYSEEFPNDDPTDFPGEKERQANPFEIPCFYHLFI